MDYKKIYIMSYKIDGKWNPMSQICIKRWRAQGFMTQLIEGYNIKKHPEI